LLVCAFTSHTWLSLLLHSPIKIGSPAAGLWPEGLTSRQYPPIVKFELHSPKVWLACLSQGVHDPIATAVPFW
jgi:hypothetical protein